MLRAGTGRAVITPRLPVVLAGYGDRTEPADRVHDDLEVRVLVLDDGSSRVALATFDLLAMTADIAGPVRERLAVELGCRPDAVITSCTHTHAGPSTLSGAEVIGWPVPERYPDLLAAQAGSAAAAAVDALVEVEARFARGPLGAGVAVDRRGHPHAPTLAVLDLVDRGGGVVASVANFGIHPTVSGPANRSVTTDWVGPFRSALEARRGGTALFLQGCQGDVNPALEWDRDDPDGWVPAAVSLGRRLADRTVDTASVATPVDGTLRLHPVRRLAPVVGDTLLSALDGGRGRREVTVASFSLGDVRVLSVPGEAFTAVEVEVLGALGPRTLLAGLAPDWHGYLPRPFGDGYEESLSFGRGFTDAVIGELCAEWP